MYRLILKDFLIQKKILIFAFLYTLFSIYAFQDLMRNDGAVYLLAPVAVIYILVNGACQLDEKSSADTVINSLPVNRTEVVVSKYLSIFLFAIYGIVCSTALGLLGRYVGFPRVGRIIKIEDIAVVVGTGMLFASIFYPLYFKFGMIKMKMANIVLFMIFLFLPGQIAEYIAKHPESAVVRYFNSLAINNPLWMLQTLVFIFACIIMLISILASIHIYKRRDF